MNGSDGMSHTERAPDFRGFLAVFAIHRLRSEVELELDRMMSAFLGFLPDEARIECTVQHGLLTRVFLSQDVPMPSIDGQ